MSQAATQELGQNLDTLNSCLQLLSERGKSLRERAALELMRAEARRIAWLVEGLNLLTAEPLVARRELRAGPLLEQVVSVLEPELRLLGVDLSLEIGEPGFTVRADERLLSLGFAGAIRSVLAVFHSTNGGRLDVRLKVAGSGPCQLLEVSQDLVTLPTSVLSRLFDLTWTDRPGGYPAAVALSVARRVAELHGGSFEVEPAKREGFWLRLGIPGARHTSRG